jgi:hypothetical protein
MATLQEMSLSNQIYSLEQKISLEFTSFENGAMQ